MKTLILMRHSKADSTGGYEDFNRPLTEKGNEDALLIGKELKKLGFLPDLIMSSTALRAISTAKIVAEEIGYKKDFELNEEFYSGDENYILEKIRRTDDSVQDLMITGHNPTLENLVNALSSKSSDLILKTSTAVIFKIAIHSWSVIDNKKNDILFVLNVN